MSIWLMLSALSAEAPFPERTPGMIEACLKEAVASDEMSKTGGTHKYVCGGVEAQELWTYLENADIEPWQQAVDGDVWQSRAFPLGACFKRIRKVDGSTASDGLSCTIWIPYRVQNEQR